MIFYRAILWTLFWEPKYHTKTVYIWAAEFHTGRIQMVHHLIFKKQHNLAACSILRGLIICKIGAFRLGVKHAIAMHSKKTIIYYQSYKFRQPQFFLHSFRYSWTHTPQKVNKSYTALRLFWCSYSPCGMNRPRHWDIMVSSMSH